RTHHAGNKRPNKSRQCTAHVAKRTERHDSAVEGEHERDQWSRDKISTEFAGHLLYPAICQPRAAASQLRVPAAADTNREAPPRILLLAAYSDRRGDVKGLRGAGLVRMDCSDRRAEGHYRQVDRGTECRRPGTGCT